MSAVGVARAAVGVTVVFVFLLIVEVAAQATCDVSVTNCVKTISHLNSGAKFLYTKKEREATCGELQSFLKCLEETGCQRLDPVEPVYRGFKHALNYTCNEENHQHEKVSTCWEWNGFRESQEFCHSMFTNRTKEPNCDDKNDAISCVIRSIGNCCGNESAEYAKKSATLMLKPTFLTAGCKLDLDKDVLAIDECSGFSAPSGPNIGLIFVIIFVIIIIVVVVVVVIIIRKSRARNNAWLSV